MIDANDPSPTVAPYGTWRSPISASMVAAGTKPLSGAKVDGGATYWLEGVFSEGGRLALMKADARGDVSTLIPAPYNVRSRVHEYGGGAWLVDGGVVWFSNFADNLVHRRDVDGTIVAITSDRAQRHADFELDRARGRLLCVQEDHGAPGEPRNRLVGIALAGSDAPRELAAGHDFYSSPRLSPDGSTLAWICWRHPQMPWDGTELWIAGFADDGSLADARCIAGGPDVSWCQPRWSPTGALFAISDASGWWNIQRFDGDRWTAVCPMEAEFAEPAWAFGASTYGFVDPTTVVAVRIVQGAHTLVRITIDGGACEEIRTAFTVFEALAVDGDSVLALVSSPATPQQVVRIDLATGAHRVLATSATELPDPSYLSTPRRVAFASTDDRVVHAYYYPPRNADFVAPAGERPPVIVQGHGGPTAMTNNGLRLGNQYWTSRGFAILDVDYAGSSGYGRAFRDALREEWGIADVDDFVAGARHVADAGLADCARMTVRGGSASGYTALCALTFRDVFRAGASAYGISDLATLIADTHKFESRYGDGLVGSIAAHPERIAERSPLSHAERMRTPMIFFQGLEDRVVPPSQSLTMVDSLRARGIPVAYLAFEGEGHGFRRFENIRRVAEAELSFYARIFGFETPDDIEPVAIDGLPAAAEPS